MRLALVIHSLSGGGAEMTAAAMASHWARAGHQVVLITLDAAAADRFPLDPQVTRIELGLLQFSRGACQAIRNNWRRVARLRRALRGASPDAIVSFTDKTNVLTLLAAPPRRVIVCERTDPRRHAIGRAWSCLRRWSYPRARAIVVQTAAVAVFVRQFAGRAPVHAIPNFVLPNPHQLSRERTIVGIGRLAAEKGFERLIEAFARFAPQHPTWNLVIYGDGPERANLQRQIERLKLTHRITLPGWTDDPQRALAAAQLFALPSRYEGFPNSLLEAMAAGLAVVSFDCDSGPREIIRHEQNGLLVPADSVDELSAALDWLLCDERLRQKLAAAAREVVDDFSVDRYYRRWSELLLEQGR